MPISDWLRKLFSKTPITKKAVQRNDAFRKNLVRRLSAVLSAYVEGLGIVRDSGLQSRELFEKLHFKTVEGKLFFHDVLNIEMEKVGGVNGLAKEDYNFSKNIGTIILGRFSTLTKKYYLEYASPQHEEFWKDVKKEALIPFIDVVRKESPELLERTARLVKSIENVDKKMSETL